MPLLCFVEHPVCSSFKMYAVLILFFHYFVSQLFTQRECVKVNFLKFQVLRERTNVFVSFPKYPVYIDFEMFSVLILGFLFWFDFPEHPINYNFERFSVLILGFLFWFVVTYSKSMCKSNSFFIILASFILLCHVWMCESFFFWKF